MGYVHKLPLPGGGSAELFDPTGGVNIERRQLFADRADILHIDEPIRELRDVILSHKQDHACLYDAEGKRIESSALVRYDWEGSKALYKAEPILLDRRTELTIDEPVVYGGVFFNHWGHFLLETFTRLSVARTHPELAKLNCVFSWRLGRERRLPVITDFLDIARAPLAVSTHHVQIRLRTCILPPAAFVISGFADLRHCTVLHDVASQLSCGAEAIDRPVYLSRTRLKTRSSGNAETVNESEFEVRLAQKGVEVIHMQELPLSEQIRIVNGRRNIIGLWGSALHNILFSLNGSSLSTFVLVKAAQHAGNFLLVDSIVGNRAHYLATLQVLPSGSQHIDIEATMDYLAAAGAFQ